MQDFIRQDKVDLTQYVPRFILKDETLSNVLKVESDEHEKQRLELIDLLKQFFVSSATWGLAKWENLLGVTPDNDDTIPQRRARIYAKLQGRQISTVAFMERLCKLFMSDDSICHVIEDNEHYIFRIIQENGSILYYNDMIDAINTYKPAHLGFRIILKRLLELTDNEKVNVGIVNAIIKESYINLSSVPDSNIPLKNGVAIGRGGRVVWGLEPPTGMETETFFGVYKKKVGKVRISNFDTATPPKFKPVPSSFGRVFIASAKSKVGTIRIEPFDDYTPPKEDNADINLFGAVAYDKGGKYSISIAKPSNAETKAYFGAYKFRTGKITISPLDEYKAPKHEPKDTKQHVNAFYGIGMSKEKKTTINLYNVPNAMNHSYVGAANAKGGYRRIGGTK